VRSPQLPDAETWDKMTAKEQWGFMQLSATCAEYRRQRARYWLAEAYAALVVIGGLLVLVFLVVHLVAHV
jgi:hypothetical protein